MSIPKVSFYTASSGPTQFGVTYFNRYHTVPFDLTLAFGKYRLNVTATR